MNEKSHTDPTITNQIAMTPVRCLEEDETTGTYPSPPKMERKRYRLATDGFFQLNQNQNFPSLFIPTLEKRKVHRSCVEKDHGSNSFNLMPRKTLRFRSTKKVTNESCISHHYDQSWQKNGHEEASSNKDNYFIPISRSLNSEA